jgi:hypothetical protein
MSTLVMLEMSVVLEMLVVLEILVVEVVTDGLHTLAAGKKRQ